jgi:hypothetical protein
VLIHRRCFFNYFVREEIVARDPAAVSFGPKVVRGLPRDRKNVARAAYILDPEMLLIVEPFGAPEAPSALARASTWSL